MNYIYNNMSTKIFPGFYESILFNSDTLLNIESNFIIPNGYELDIIDFNEFMVDVAKKVANVLWDELPNNDVILDINYKDLYSPTYYNYSTDKLILDIDVDINNLYQYCYVDNKAKFMKYLQDNHTSYDGFVSLVPNNIEEFKVWEDDLKINVLLEFFFLNELDIESYYQELFSSVNEILYQHLCITDSITNEKYDYCYDEDKIVICDKILLDK